MATTYVWIPVMVAVAVIAVVGYAWFIAACGQWVVRRWRGDTPLQRESERLRRDRESGRGRLAAP